MTDKKPTKPVSKNQKKSKSKKQTKKPLKLVKLANQSHHGLFPASVSHADIQPPDGFRSVSTTQALMEYASPIMDIAPLPTNDIKRANEILNVATEIWNYTIDESILKEGKKSEKEMLSLISQRLGLDQDKANEFLSMMVERKDFLFPDEVQPKGYPFMFLRKQVSYLISKFNNEELNLSKKILDPNVTEIGLVENIDRLDQYIVASADYGQFEKLLLKVQDTVFDRFKIWLSKKGVSKHQEQFAYMAGVYLEFMYGYEHEQPLILKEGPGKYLVEFTVDFILRKVSFEPWEYTLVPSALRLFYTFLYEKGYFHEPPNVMTEFIDRLEPRFIDILKERFS